MIRLLLIFLFLLHSSLQAYSMEEAKKEGRQFAKKATPKKWKDIDKISAEELTPKDLKGQSFDVHKASEQVENQDIPPNEISEFLNDERIYKNVQENSLVDQNDYVFKKSEEIFQNGDKYIQETVEETADYHIEKCFEIGFHFPLSLIKRLNVQVIEHPEIRKKVKVCLGHKHKKKHYWKEDAKKYAKEQENKLSSDSKIMKYAVKIKKGSGITKHYKVISEWLHYDEAVTCDAYKTEIKKTQEKSFDEEDAWIVENENALLDSPQCTFIRKDCLELALTKRINGKDVFRQCWLEKLNYLCKYDRKNSCEFLASKNCTLIEKKCIENSENGCSLWELTYRCLSNIHRHSKQLDPSAVFGSNEEEWETSYSPNNSFSNVCTTLSVFEAIKQDVENAQLFDSSQIQVFKGKKSQCSKNKASDLMYDCCFSYKGLANDLKLSQCTADEIALEQMREKGLCYYLGSYEEKFLDLWTSRTEHVFCCFNTKLARVFHEQARKQLGIDWGTPKHPNCRGLTTEEIGKLDFTKLNLSEAYEKLPEMNKIPDQSKLKEKSDAIEKRLQEKMKDLGDSHV